MNFIISFFRDTIDGGWYLVYILVCIFFIFVLLGIVGDRKRAVIEAKLKEKKAQDIASGKEAKIAARESKQILDVMDDNATNSLVSGDNSAVSNSTESLAKNNGSSSVLVIGADGSSNYVAPVINPNLSSGNSSSVPTENSLGTSINNQGSTSESNIQG